MRQTRLPLALATTAFAVGVFAVSSQAHEQHPASPHQHQGPTYEVTAALRGPPNGKMLRLDVLDEQTGQPTTARFSVEVNGESYVPHALGKHGLRFVSIHQGKRQRFVALYARGTGAVEVPLPDEARQVRVSLAKGLEYLPQQVPFRVGDGAVGVRVRLRRWSDLREAGWLPADEHLHYDRTDPAHDADWLTLLAADDLTHAHFLVLKGGNLPGTWARQFAYGPAGEASDGQRLIRPGEEYRDGSQGHINLLGIREVLPPISTGGIGQPPVPYNYPPLYDVFLRARELGGVGGPSRTFATWKQALARGEVFTTSGPLVEFTVDGAGPGGVVRLPPGGAEVAVRAELASPLPLQTLEVVRNAQVVLSATDELRRDGVHRRRIEAKLKVRESCWLAARGTGVAKQKLRQHTGIKQNTFAHSAAVAVLVGEP